MESIKTVSIAIPVHNMQDWIADAITSALSQTYAIKEVIVFDNGSTDKTLSVARSFTDERLKVFNTDIKLSISDSFNNAITKCSGDYVQMLCADDILSSEFTEKAILRFNSIPNLGMVSSWPEFIEVDGSPLKETNKDKRIDIEKPTNRSREEWLNTLQNGNLFFAGWMFSMSALKDAGLMDDKISTVNDLDLIIRVLIAGYDINVIEEPLYKFRLRPDSESSIIARNQIKWANDIAFIKKKYFLKYIEENEPMKLLIATPFYEVKAYSPYVSSLIQTITALTKAGMHVDFWNLSGDSYIDRARNDITNKFMYSKYTHLFFIDSDMAWELEGFINVLKHKEPIVGAGYPCKNKWDFYSCVLNTDKEGIPVGTESGLIDAHSVPTGFMKIKRDVFIKLVESGTVNSYIDSDGKLIYDFFGRIPPMGEDTSFCKRWRDIGGKLYVEPRVNISHMGVTEYKGNYDTFLRSCPGGTVK